MLKSLPVQLVICIAAAFLVGGQLDLPVVQFFFGLSCLIKDVLMLALPLVIITYLAAAILSLQQKAPILILSIMLLVCLSNIAAVFASYLVGQLTLPVLAGNVVDLSTAGEVITPLFSIPFPRLLEPSNALLIGMAYGFFFSFKKVEKATKLILNLRDYVTLFLQKVFIPFLPLYVFGFVLKMQKEGNLGALIANYGQVFLVMCTLIVTYIIFMYALAHRFNAAKTWKSLRTMMPAALTGFTTMSSAATMPITLAATEENTKDTRFTQLVIPTTVNIHLLGDALGIPLIGLAILQLSGLPLPSFEQYLIFSAYFCMAKFSTAGIPGGGVLVLLPTLQTHLGLSVEMTGLVATIYILQDSLFTSANVMGNGAFALVCHRFFQTIRLIRPAVSPQEASI